MFLNYVLPALLFLAAIYGIYRLYLFLNEPNERIPGVGGGGGGYEDDSDWDDNQKQS